MLSYFETNRDRDVVCEHSTLLVSKTIAKLGSKQKVSKGRHVTCAEYIETTFEYT